ncbi:MAG: DNA gyrase C-terminal beta-propeller domain-containing protein, partial [Clostridia bacterium]
SEDDEKPIENKIIGLAFDGTIKCIPVKNFNMSDKSATDRSSLAEIHSRLIDVMSNHTVIFFTNKGNCYQTLVSDIPETKYRDGGTKLSDIFKMAIEGEVAVSAFAFGESMPDGEVIIFTRQGMAKRSSWDEYDLLKSSFQGYKCKDDDEVIAVEQVLPDSTALYVTSKGMCINYNVSEVPVQGRVAGGVKGMALDEGDFVVSAHQISNEGEVVVVTDKCYLKRILTCDIPIVTRYRKGVKILDFGASNGSAVIYADYVTIPYDIALIDPASTLVINTEDINIENRNGKGKAPKQRKNGGKLVAVYHYKIAPDLVYRDVKDKRKRRATAITDTDVTTATAVKSSAKPKKAIVNNSDEQQTIIVKPDTVD